MKRMLVLLGFLVLMSAPHAAYAFDFNPNNIISDFTFTDTRGMSLDSVREFLKKGFLSTYETLDFEGNMKSAAEIIYESAHRYGVNPKVLIVLLQKEQGLITDNDPTDRQLDWATGYAVCDGCELADPRVQRWKGFGKQVNSAAAQFIEGYFEDIATTGSVNGKYGPDIPVTISGQQIIPENAATASLYAYTPHLSGNRLFAQLWNQWFASNHPEGTLIKSEEAPEVYVIKNGLKRHITSFAVLVSRFDENLISIVDQSVIDGIPSGNPIKYPNYSLLSIDGGRFLIVDDTIRPFQSLDAFRQLGFQEGELVEASYDDVDSYIFGDTITEDTQYPTGRLVQISTSGSLYYLEGRYRHFVYPELRNMQFRRYPVYPVAPNEISGLIESTPSVIADGYLVSTESSPDIYLISEGKRRHIASEEAFSTFGWSEGSIVTVDEALLDLHPVGDAIDVL